jgi:hypothetical protein
MMPELASLPDAERKSILKIAKRKSLRNLGIVAFDWSGAVIGNGCVLGMLLLMSIFAVAFSHEIEFQNAHIRNIERAYNAVAQKIPETPLLQPFHAVGETSWAHWFSTHDTLLYLVALALIMLLTYYFLRVWSCFENVVLMMYARVVMAEKAALPSAHS